ncbi:MAG: glycosyltransferase [Candidatus Omnitrophica bacterium]|nr:glycosyltransferase [Candidatus Omnitrophota bacterium]
MWKIAVVVVTRNNCDMLKQLINDLEKQTFKPKQIWIIDNASSDGTEAFLQNFSPPFFYVRFSQNTGSAGGYYEGILRAKQDNDAVWLLDDDVTVSENALEELVKHLDLLVKKKPIGAVRSWCASDCPYKEPFCTDSFAWRGTLITEEAISTVGLPQRDYFLYADDTEYALRIKEAGFSIFWVPSSRVIEKRLADKELIGKGVFKTTLVREPAKLYYAFRNQLHVGIKYKKWWQVVKTFLFAVKVIFVFSLGKRKESEKIIAVKLALKDGFCGRLGRHPHYIL